MTSSTHPTRTAPRTAATRTAATRAAATLGAAALTLALTACGSSSDGHSPGSTAGTSHTASPSSSAASPASTSTSTSASSSGEHNSADVTFAQQMVVHHEGAIAMADLAADRAGDQRVKDLAARIRAAQAPEVQQMTGWLQSWGATGGTDHSSGTTDHSAMADGPAGMMSQKEVDQLSAARGAAFDRVFLQMMVVHHQGAIEMAQQEQADGASPEAKALADSVVTSQTAEVSEMRQLLTELG